MMAISLTANLSWSTRYVKCNFAEARPSGLIEADIALLNSVADALLDECRHDTGHSASVCSARCQRFQITDRGYRQRAFSLLGAWASFVVINHGLLVTGLN